MTSILMTSNRQLHSDTLHSDTVLSDTAGAAELPRRRGEQGFSLVELLVGMAIMVEVLVVVLLLFDVNARVSRVETQIADLQQSQRIGQRDIVRLSRMAGRGNLPTQWAITHQDNVGAGTTIGANNVVTGTDILTIRGVFTSPIYQVNNLDSGSFSLTGTSLQIRVNSYSPAGIPQPLDSIADALNPSSGSPRPEAMVLVSPVDAGIYAVLELQTGGSVINAFDVNGDGSIAPDEKQAVLSFSTNAGSGTYNAQYSAMSTGGAFPAALSATAFIGILEEYRFYIRDDSGALGESSKLSRARFYPNTNAAHDADANNLRIDIADNVLDLQVALGLDVDEDGEIDESPSNKSVDEWRFNDPNDQTSAASWLTAGGAFPDLFAISVTTLVKSDRPDRGYMAAPIQQIENNVYSEPATPANQQEELERSHRRRQMQSIVDLRNLG